MQSPLEIRHYPQGGGAEVVAVGQRRIIDQSSARAYHYGGYLTAPFVHKPLSQRMSDPHLLPVSPHQSVLALCIFQDDIWTAGSHKVVTDRSRMIGVAVRVELQHLNSGFLQVLYSFPIYPGCVIQGADDHSWDAFPDNEIGAGRRITSDTARFQRDVERCGAQQVAVCGSHRCHGVHLSMGLPVDSVPPLADDLVPSHQYGTYHGVGCHRTRTETGELGAAGEESSVKVCLRNHQVRRIFGEYQNAKRCTASFRKTGTVQMCFAEPNNFITTRACHRQFTGNPE